MRVHMCWFDPAPEEVGLKLSRKKQEMLFILLILWERATAAD